MGFLVFLRHADSAHNYYLGERIKVNTSIRFYSIGFKNYYSLLTISPREGCYLISCFGIPGRMIHCHPPFYSILYSVYIVYAIAYSFSIFAIPFGCNALGAYSYSLYMAYNGFYVPLGGGYYVMSKYRFCFPSDCLF